MANFRALGVARAVLNTLYAGTIACVLLLCSNLAQADALANSDPWEGVNRRIHTFNDGADRAIIKPIAQTYDRLLPGFLKRGIHNIFRNLGTPAVLLNQFLQGKPRQGASDTARLVLNSTLGIGGIFDVATPAGLVEHDEDFGQTLRVWGLSNGPYLVVPFRGPATVTHAGAMIVDSLLNPVRLVSPARDRYAIVAVSLVDSRVALLQTEALVRGDRYVFFREAYLQRREFLVNDGVMAADPFFDDFEDDAQ